MSSEDHYKALEDTLKGILALEAVYIDRGGNSASFSGGFIGFEPVLSQFHPKLDKAQQQHHSSTPTSIPKAFKAPNQVKLFIYQYRVLSCID